MIEPPNTEINIDEIMRRIKEEVERRRKLSGQETYQEAKQLISKSSTIGDNTIKKSFDHFLWKYGRRYKRLIKTVPILKDIAKKQHSRLARQFIYSHPLTLQSLPSQLDTNLLPNFLNYHGFLIQVKEEGLKGRIKSFLFKFIRFFAWWQEQINRALYQELMTQKAKMDERDRGIQELLQQLTLFDRVKDELYQELNDQKSKIDEAGKWMKALFDQQVDGLKSELAERNKVIEGLNNRLVDFNRVEEELSREVTTQKEKLEGIEKQTQNLVTQEINTLKTEFTETNKNFNDAIESMKKELIRLIEVESAINHIIKQMRDHKLHILDQQRRLTLLLEEARKRLPEPISTQQIQNILKEEDHLLDAMYVAFEDRFRGTREDIKERLKVYLPYVKQAKIGKRSSPIVDLGCGRGEWLEILKEEGYVTKGIEINRVMLDGCRERNLDVVEAGAIEYLRSQKANSFGAITGFHLVEHLSLKDLISLFDECLRVLKPKGMIIFETPNPENLIVGAYTFHFDPTHRCLLVPESLNFIAQQRGFVNTNILRLHKYSDFNPIDQAAADDFKNKWFYSETDFALIGYKS